MKEVNDDIKLSEAQLAELESLTETMGATVVASQIITLRQKNPATLIGSGKLEELSQTFEELPLDFIIFDYDLAPRVQRNLERFFNKAVIDRQEVILQIFSDRAVTKEATLQVALARQMYSLPRLERMWSHLSRQRGGMRGTRDAGETQLEIDRRLVLKKISSLKKELEKVVAQRAVQRKSRLENSITTVAIVGYTNAGKSSLLNLLSESDIFVEDKLFATLDPTTRKINLPQGLSVLFTDTVGFVSNLPHHLVNAFKSTLEETQYSDLILHVVDASHPNMLQCFDTTVEVLDSLNCSEKPTIVFINKSDVVYNHLDVDQIVAQNPISVVGSVKTGENIDLLLNLIEQEIVLQYAKVLYFFPHSRGDLVALLRKEALVTKLEYLDEGALVEAKVPAHLQSRLTEFIKK
ncbi:MAG: GTPase HflX [Sphaerochaetaceae bacterium]